MNRIWSIGQTAMFPVYAVMQGDGNFVVYKSTNAERSDLQEYWRTNTLRVGNEIVGPYTLRVENYGNLVLYNGNMEAQWNSLALPNKLLVGGNRMVRICINGIPMKVSGNSVKLNTGNPINFKALVGISSIYRFNEMRFAFAQDGNTDVCLRHAGFWMYLHPFITNNYDFAWIVLETTGITSGNEATYMIHNDFGGGTYGVGYEASADQFLIVPLQDSRLVKNFTFQLI